MIMTEFENYRSYFVLIKNLCVYIRSHDFCLSSVWSAGIEDSASLRASDVRSPLPFTAQFHSTPNSWDDKLHKQTVMTKASTSSAGNISSNSLNQVSKLVKFLAYSMQTCKI